MGHSMRNSAVSELSSFAWQLQATEQRTPSEQPSHEMVLRVTKVYDQ
jgi:hypothetical protein